MVLWLREGYARYATLDGRVWSRGSAQVPIDGFPFERLRRSGPWCRAPKSSASVDRMWLPPERHVLVAAAARRFTERETEARGDVVRARSRARESSIAVRGFDSTPTISSSKFRRGADRGELSVGHYFVATGRWGKARGWGRWIDARAGSQCPRQRPLTRPRRSLGSHRGCALVPGVGVVPRGDERLSRPSRPRVTPSFPRARRACSRPTAFNTAFLNGSRLGDGTGASARFSVARESGHCRS
jgi:hypothetical protein